MRCFGLLAFSLLAGCSSTGHEIGVGVGREFRDGGFTVADRFNEQPGGEDTSLLVDYDERDVDTLNLWYVWHFDTPRERVLDGPAPVRRPDLSTETEAPGAPLDKEDVVDLDWVEVLAGIIVLIGTALGGRHAKRRWSEWKQEKEK